jgi:hypothetical protein
MYIMNYVYIMNYLLCIYYVCINVKTHSSGTQNQYFNYIMPSITLHKHLAFTYIFENELGVSNQGCSTKATSGSGRELHDLASWSACWSLIFCEFLVGSSRIIDGAFHSLALPWLRACRHFIFSNKTKIFLHYYSNCQIPNKVLGSGVSYTVICCIWDSPYLGTT